MSEKNHIMSVKKTPNECKNTPDECKKQRTVDRLGFWERGLGLGCWDGGLGLRF